MNGFNNTKQNLSCEICTAVLRTSDIVNSTPYDLQVMCNRCRNLNKHLLSTEKLIKNLIINHKKK